MRKTALSVLLQGKDDDNIWLLHNPHRPTSMSAAVARPAAAPGVQVTAPSRREFLNYIWIASMALLLGETSAGLIWFAFPRFKEGEFGGTFAFDPEELPGARVRRR